MFGPFLILLSILPWLIVGFGCWLGYQLVQQNGRILLRLEALEKQLAGLAPASARATAPVAPAERRGLAIGSAAPDFTLPDLAGAQHTLAEYRGKKRLLIFFNPGCGFCQKMLSDLAGLPVDDADGKPVPLVITTGDAERNRQLVSVYGISCPVLIQEQMEIASAYQAHGTPMGYILDEEGKIASGLAIGAQALLDLADGKPAALPEPSRNGHQVGSRDLSQSRINRGGLAPGTPAPDFRLPLLEGGELSLSELRGRKVLLVFSDPHCGPCDSLMPQLEGALGIGRWAVGREGGVRRRALGPDLNAQRPALNAPKAQRSTLNADLQVLIVSRGEVEENREKAKRHGLTFPMVLQKKWEVSKLYAMFATPVAYLIDEQGVIAAEVATGPEPILALARGAMAAAEEGTLEPALAGAGGRNGRADVRARGAK